MRDLADDFAGGGFIGRKNEVAKHSRCAALAAIGNAVLKKAIFKDLRQGSVFPGPDFRSGRGRIPRWPGGNRRRVAAFG